MARTWWSSSNWRSASGRGWQDWEDDNGWGCGWWARLWDEGIAQQAKQQTAVAAPDRAGASERADAETRDEEAAGSRDEVSRCLNTAAHIIANAPGLCTCVRPALGFDGLSHQWGMGTDGDA